ncbi:MAG: hypothetical protein WBA74_07385 [Cyclobacteriaceae bacterium]
MIRIISETEGLDGQAIGEKLVRRHFVPVAITVRRSGDFKLFREKIPHGTHKVVGILVSVDAPERSALHNKIYFGAGAADTLVNETFIRNLNADQLANSQYTRYKIQVGFGEKLYFAQPRRLQLSRLVLNGQSNQFETPIGMEFTNPFNGDEEDYNVWVSKSSGLGLAELLVRSYIPL